MGRMDFINIAIPPLHYIHVLDKNTHVSRMIPGPAVYFRKVHESVSQQPTRMIVVTSKEYCLIRNPCKKDDEGNPILNKSGSPSLLNGDSEYRFAQPPFPLYPGEILEIDVTPLTILQPNEALLLSAIVAFSSEDGKSRRAGERWLFEGPGVYMPRKEVEVLSHRQSELITIDTAISLKALTDYTDKFGKKRTYGESWLVKEVGAYMPDAYEELVSRVSAHKLDKTHALHVRAKNTHTDDFGKRRRLGEEWLITHNECESHIPSVYEEIVEEVAPIVLSSKNYCVVCDPVDDNGVPQIGKRVLIRGEKSFFLMPGEHLQRGIENVYILGKKDGIVLRALESFEDATIQRIAGEEWMLTGPLEYVPPIEVEVVAVRSAIPLDENEGIYVRDRTSGRVRAVVGSTYLLNQNEELWEKKLSPSVERILASNKAQYSKDDSVDKVSVDSDWVFAKIITYKVPHNSAVQLYDYREKTARVIVGPELVMLGPDEQFTLLNLSGGKPKQPNKIEDICLRLGSDFCSDLLIVETSDHARLSVQLSYNWHFEVSPQPTKEEAEKLFSKPDFIGDFCKLIASRVRGSVSSVSFDAFRKKSAEIITSSVFGTNQDGSLCDRVLFTQNNLVISSVDIQSVEPVDKSMRDSLQKSVQLAIELTSKSQEADARHDAERLEQEAKGRQERQRISDQAIAENARKSLLEVQMQMAALESSGKAQEAVRKAELEAEAEQIRTSAEMKRMKLTREAELEYLQRKNELEIEKKRREFEIETKFYLERVNAVGAENLRLIACAGPERDVRMLRALNLRSTLITDGRSPINLLDATSGLIGQTASTVHQVPHSPELEAGMD